MSDRYRWRAKLRCPHCPATYEAEGDTPGEAAAAADDLLPSACLEAADHLSLTRFSPARQQRLACQREFAA